LSGDERSPLRRAFIGPRNNVADEAGVPAISRFNEKIVLGGAVPAYFAEGDVKPFGADPRRFRQDLQEIGVPQGNELAPENWTGR
jgi:hypothetical protein